MSAPSDGTANGAGGSSSTDDKLAPVDVRLDSQQLEVAIGPQHPSTHGVFRMDVALDGERVVKLKPVMGYLHRNHEQIAEQTSYLGTMPFTDRLDYFNSMANNWGYALTVEKLTGLKPPERAEYIRVIMCELTRVLNHTAVTGFLLNDLGAWMTPLLYAFREREKILDVFEAVSGARLMCNYFRFGGVRTDMTDADLAAVRAIVDAFPAFLDEMERLITENEILVARTQGVGVLSKELAISAGISGPMARASGVEYDIRKIDKYGIYDRFDFRVPIGEHGDVFDRYYVRLLEVRESLKILDQALKAIPKGPILDAKSKIRGFRVPKGEAYGRIESPKGELGFYVVAEGDKSPYRYHVRAPSFINLTILEDMCLGEKIADAIVILGAVDIVLGEVDR
jgi:NADH-quinone oxidoreductase subunit D